MADGTKDLDNQVAIITGASSGIGEATAQTLARHGARVVLVARRKDKLDALAASIQKAGGEALVIEADVTGKAVCKRVIKQTINTYGKIDILVNNAGVMLLGPASKAPIEEWEQMIHLNLLGLMYMTYEALPHMRKNSGSTIVNISSVAGRTVNSGSAVYNATKWGVNAFTESLRQELTGDKTGVRTTIIEPGAVLTELVSHNRPESQEVIEERFKNISKRLESDDIARAILYAVSQPPHVSINEMLIRPTEQPG
jgi:NADP-dependent 3-hydroxy acid dehydrogenase YdfG